MRAKAASAVQEKTVDDARELFSKSVKAKLNISVAEFMQSYWSGAYEQREDCEIANILMLLPYTGYIKEYGNEQSRRRQ